MFVRHHVIVERSLRECEKALTQTPSSWMPHLAGHATESGEHVLARVGFKLGAIPVRKRVELRLGERQQVGDWLRFPISWKATFPSGLFPVFEGQLELVPLGPDRTRVAVAGYYTPPLSEVGDQLDSLLLHNVAEATIKDFVESLAQRLGSSPGRSTARGETG